jgi:threonine dehydratase/serine racemase
MADYAIGWDNILQARDRLRGVVYRTPVFTCETLNSLAGRQLYFKCENLQKTGSFKYRGASNAVLSLDAATAARGVVTHSSGNHAQALALAAAKRGIPAHIVMPRTASPVKKQAVLDYGGRVVECEPNLPAREETAARVQAETGATMVPPFEHPLVMAGQGTACVELLEDHPHLDAVVAPVGGGGLLSGFCVAAQGMQPRIRVFGAEPLNADDAARSKAGGVWVPQTNPQTIADGLMTSLGQLTWPIIRDRVETIYTVTESEIVTAMRLVWERMKLVIEPSAAVGVAVVLGEPFRALKNLHHVGVVFCGGNVSLDKLYW